CRPRKGTPDVLPTLGSRNQAFALGLLAGGLARTSDGFRLLATLALGGLFIGLAALHLTKDAFALHLLLEDLEGLIDIVIPNEYLKMLSNRAVAVMSAEIEMRFRRMRTPTRTPRRGWTGDKVVNNVARPRRSATR